MNINSPSYIKNNNLLSRLSTYGQERRKRKERERERERGREGDALSNYITLI
jgi:hypothetical protein